MKNVICLALLFLLTGCYRDGRGVVIAAHDIPAQTLIQRSDLDVVSTRVYKPRGTTVRDSRDIIGHKALHTIHHGELLDRSDFN